MLITSIIYVNTFTLVSLIVIYFASRHRIVKKTMEDRLFLWVLRVTMVLLVFDTFGRLDGNPGTYYEVLNRVGNFVLFFLSPIIPSLWLLYVYNSIFQKSEVNKPIFYFIVGINLVNIIFLVISQFNGWYYFINAENIYVRGPLYEFCSSFTISLILAAFIMILLNRKRIPESLYGYYILFALSPIIGVILQIFIYGYPFMLNNIFVSVLIIYINIQNQTGQTDFLTECYNRKKLEITLNHRIKSSSRRKTFSAIMIDINNFKFINDTYGHHEGDSILKITAKLLQEVTSTNDVVARFGGDEFFLVLSISDHDALSTFVRLINERVELFNQSKQKPYQLGFSMGYDVYDPRSGMGIREFEEHIDQLMYSNKAEGKATPKGLN